MFVLDELSSLFLTLVAECGDRGPVGGCADKDLVDVSGVEISVLIETHAEFAVERVDEKIKQLVLVDFIICLLLAFSYTIQ